MKKASFPPSAHLLTSRDFSRVFKRPKKLSSQYLALFIRENDINKPRLGLVISKKSAKRAVDRNKIKRIIRERFRLQQDALNAFDIVALSYKGLGELDKVEIRECVDLLFSKAKNLQKK